MVKALKALPLTIPDFKWFEPRSHIKSVKYDCPGECNPEKDCLW